MLPRRLALVLPTSYSPSCLDLAKDTRVVYHSEFPCHAFAHCRGSAPAASRRTRTLVSVSFSGLQLPLPPPIIGLVSRYLANYLIGRSLILRQMCSISHTVSTIKCSNIYDLCGISLTFARLSPSSGQIDYVLLSRTPPNQVVEKTCMA